VISTDLTHDPAILPSPRTAAESFAGDSSPGDARLEPVADDDGGGEEMAGRRVWRAWLVARGSGSRPPAGGQGVRRPRGRASPSPRPALLRVG